MDNTTQFTNDNCLPPPINCALGDEPKWNNNGPSRSIVTLESSKTQEPFEVCSRNTRRVVEQFGPMNPIVDLQTSQTVLQAALHGINVLSDAKVDVLATLTGFEKNGLR